MTEQPPITTNLTRVVVLASGQGTNLQAIIDAQQGGVLPIKLVGVIYNQPGAQCVGRAEQANIPAYFIPSRGINTEQYGEILLTTLINLEPDLMVAAGFGRILGTQVIAAFPNQIINIHPALLPAFAGNLHAQADALTHGVKISGCSVHFVTNEVDGGPIITQAAVPVREDDTVESLSKRILEQEHRILIDAIALLAEERIRIEGRRVHILETN